MPSFLTTAGSAVGLCSEGYAYLRRRESSRGILPWLYAARECIRYFDAATRRIEGSKKPGRELTHLNANRDGKRGKVFTLGPIAAGRFGLHRVPQVILREDRVDRIARAYRIASELYLQGLPVAPLAWVSPRRLVSVHLGDNLMHALGTYDGERREEIERRLFADLYTLNHALADSITAIRRPTSPRVESVPALFTPMRELAASHLTVGRTLLRELRKEIGRNIENIPADWPFVDSSLRNFGIYAPGEPDPLGAYLCGRASIVQYDPDRFDRLSGRSFNLANLVFQDWQTLSLPERLRSEDGRFLHGALHYLARQVSRSSLYGITTSGSVPGGIERATLERQVRELSWVLDQSELRCYPVMREILTAAAPTSAH